MKKKLAWIAIVAVTVLAGVASVDAADDAKTLTGTYVWEQGSASGDIEAVFTPAGEAIWDVSFHFSFRSKPHTYTGTAKGDLDAGTLSGTVLNESKKRTFTFEGTFDDGVFSGTHAEMHGEDKQATGTITLR